MCSVSVVTHILRGAWDPAAGRSASILGGKPSLDNATEVVLPVRKPETDCRCRRSVPERRRVRCLGRQRHADRRGGGEQAPGPHREAARSADRAASGARAKPRPPPPVGVGERWVGRRRSARDAGGDRVVRVRWRSRRRVGGRHLPRQVPVRHGDVGLAGWKWRPRGSAGGGAGLPRRAAVLALRQRSVAELRLAAGPARDVYAALRQRRVPERAAPERAGRPGGSRSSSPGMKRRI
jgi:hypothetical protein